MATFTQWAGKKNLKRLAWVCGPEQVLQAEVIDTYRAAVPSGFRVSLDAAGGNETEIWDEVFTDAGFTARLLVVHNADKLKTLANFELLAEADVMATSFVVFTSSEPDFPRDGRALAVQAATIQKCKDGQVIRCTSPSKEEDLVRLVSSWWPGSGGNLAFELLKRVGGDLGEAREACWKATLAGLEPSAQAVEVVAEVQPSSGFTDALLARDRQQAAMLATKLSRDEVGYSLAVLSSRLNCLDTIRAAQVQGMDRQDMATRLKIDRYVLRQLVPAAPHYGPERVRALRELLATAETYYRAGAYEGIAEAVAALW